MKIILAILLVFIQTNKLMADDDLGLYLIPNVQQVFLPEFKNKVSVKISPKNLLISIQKAPLKKSSSTWLKQGHLLVFFSSRNKTCEAFEWQPWSAAPKQLIPVSLKKEGGKFIRGERMFGPDLKVPEISDEVNDALEDSLNAALLKIPISR